MSDETFQTHLGFYSCDSPAERVRRLRAEASQLLRQNGKPTVGVPDDAE